MIAGQEEGKPLKNIADHGPRRDPDCGVVRRITGKELLRLRSKQLRAKADQLDALADALPEKLPYMADDGLLGLAQDIRGII